jgi:hypothetical protein
MASKHILLTDKERLEILACLPAKSKIRAKLLKADQRIKTSSAKAKGRNLQYWVCERIASLLGLEFNQSDDQCLIHSREMGQSGKDIIIRGDAYKRFPYSIEAKNSESLQLPTVIAQVQANTTEKEDWIIVHKRKTIKDPIAIMDWMTFEKLYRSAHVDK